jgi:hypothetical protein
VYIKDDFLKTAFSRHFNFVVAILVASLIFVVFALGFVALLRCHFLYSFHLALFSSWMF